MCIFQLGASHGRERFEEQNQRKVILWSFKDISSFNGHGKNVMHSIPRDWRGYWMAKSPTYFLFVWVRYVLCIIYMLIRTH